MPRPSLPNSPAFLVPGRALVASVSAIVLASLISVGCTASQKRAAVDKRTASIIAEKQKQALGQTSEFTILPAEETLRRRLLLDQHLPTIGAASYGPEYVETPSATPERVAAKPLPARAENPAPALPRAISLVDSLQIAAANSRAYQARKEQVFRSALLLDLEREEFRTSFAGLVSTLFREDRTQLDSPAGVVTQKEETSALAEASKTLKTGGQLTLRIGIDLVKLLEPGRFNSQSIYGDASATIPLLRGAGRRVAAEGLTQAERNTLYAIYDFEEYKRGFAVGIARQYFAVLQAADVVRNNEEAYRSLIVAARRARRLRQAGLLTPIQMDQALQDELRARNRWISARSNFSSQQDNLKLQLGLPADAVIELQRGDLESLAEAVRVANPSPELPAADEPEEQIPPADAPVDLDATTAAPPGRFELAYDRALRLAFDHRLDLRVALARIEDAQRSVIVAADGFKPGLSLRLRGTTRAEKTDELDLDHGNYSAGLLLDLPLERTREAIAYRNELINYQAAIRALQEFEDTLKLNIRARLRTLREARESLRIQTSAVQLARRRVRGADLNLQAGRVPIRDLLEAQDALLTAQNALTSATVGYRLAELDLQRDLGVLVVGPDGLWREFNPEAGPERASEPAPAATPQPTSP